MEEKNQKSNLLKNNLQAFAYLVLIAILSMLLMLNWYLAYAWPDALALPILLLIPLGMTLYKFPGIKRKALSVISPLACNLFLLITAYGKAGGFPHEIPKEKIGPWMPITILNPGIMAISFFSDPSREILRYGLILLLPSILLLIGMMLKERLDFAKSEKSNEK